ncbi:restriction endonuclease family protein [Lyngbya aestuarii BL J]|uniref:Restriction endonuclease family protein n=1 Tax=Lyngbya aestuarii BL J TaxID=1348334 RepID=U7QH48_9CYAN|nr:Uma2 family endonuclease [Lyngbya aestuarii]ERT07223.1 restriction endonuclease family protein [Lyngbya aestuarii BL J]
MSETTPITPYLTSLPPTQEELPYDDGEPMESQRHQFQMEILINTLQPWMASRSDGFVGGNMFVYYSLEQVRNKDFRGPDFFAVLGVPKKERRSWVVWEEGKAPDVVIELLSESTAELDKTEKKYIYQDRLRVSEYFWFDPFNPEDLAGFSLQQGVFQPIDFNPQNQLVSQALGLSLVRWFGEYQGIEATWLRWADLDGELFLLPQEIAEQEFQRAEQAHQRAEQEFQRAEQVESQLNQAARTLLQQGMTQEQVMQVTGLSLATIQELIDTNR